MKRIAWFFPSFGGGGVQRTILRLAPAFIGRGIAVDLLVVRAGGPFIGDVPPAANVVDLKAPGVLAAVPGLVSYLRASPPDALVSAQNHVNLAAVLAHRLSGSRTRLILTEHNDMLVGLRQASGTVQRLRAPAARLLYPLADEVVAVSKGVGESVRMITGLPPERIHTIYHPSVPENLEALLARSPEHAWLVTKEQPVVLAVGRLADQKDFKTLLQALRILNETSPVRLVILGEGPQRGPLEDLAARLGIADRISMPGFISNPYACMSRADVFVLSSRYEGFPTVLVEALACGTKVVSTDCRSGPAEILDGGPYGRLVPVGDSLRMAQAIREALDDRGFVPQTAMERASAFSVERAVSAYMPLLFPGDSA